MNAMMSTVVTLMTKKVMVVTTELRSTARTLPYNCHENVENYSDNDGLNDYDVVIVLMMVLVMGISW